MRPVSQTKASDYSARHLSVLEGLEAVRKRPGMYIGSTDHKGLMHCLWEIIDNAVDEALEGHCDTIDVRLHPDHSASVSDNGRGVPVDEVPGIGLSGVEVVYTKLHAGGKFGGGSYGAAGGLHGVGASVVNALSARMDVQVDRGSKTYEMCFRRGEPGEFDDSRQRTPNSPFTPFTDQSRLKTVGKVKRTKTGTRVRFWADFQIFPATEGFSWESLLARARQTAFLVPGLTINCVDERGEEERSESFRFDGGVVDFTNWLATDGPVTDTWHITGEGAYTETVQVLDADTGHLTATELERVCSVDIALRWGIGYDTSVRSFVNIIATPKGGTHVAGFEQAVLRVLRAQIDKNSRKLKVGAKDGRPEKDDVLAGMTAVVTVRFPEPQFEGQTKEILGTPQIRSVVSKVVGDWLGAKLASPKRDDKQQASQLMEKVVGEMKARVSARIHKEISRKKNALETSSLPAKLADCRLADVAETELFIVEGDSALGTAKAARNSHYQALFPIRGKILNVQKASTADMLANAECANIIQVIGAGSGRTFDLESARYGKVILMTDADVDGAHGAHLRRRAAPAPHRGGGQGPPETGVHLHLLRGRAAPQARRPAQIRAHLEGAHPALQGPGRDGRRPAGRDHDGPRPPLPAAHHPGRRGGPAPRRGRLRTAHGLHGGPSARVHRRGVGGPGPRPHRRLTGGGPRGAVLGRSGAARAGRRTGPDLARAPAS